VKTAVWYLELIQFGCFAVLPAQYKHWAMVVSEWSGCGCN